MDYTLFISIFSLIFIAELPDKTAFATLLMATKGSPLPIFFGAASAFFVQCFIAILFGSLLSLLPASYVQLGAGLLYLYFAYHTWFHHEEDEEEAFESTPNVDARMHFWTSYTKAFMAIFIAEWGDITQISTAALAAKYSDHKVTVFVASLLALWSVTLLAIVVGTKLKTILKEEHLKKLSTLCFTGIGLFFIITWLKETV